MDLTVEPSRLSMTSKVVLGVLLLVNFTVALYLLFAEPSSVRDGVPRSSFPANQTLTLISELDPSEKVPLVEAGERPFTPSTEGAAPLTCQAWGPFANAEVLAPVQALVLEADPAARVVSFEIEAAPDFLVYLDSDNNLDNARRILQELESQGIEAYVIAGGEYINSVSAGVFSNQQGANGLVERLRDLGYAPELQALERAQQVTYLLGRVPDGFRAGDAESVACGTIAQLQEFL
jgi:cell division septation protein DedD